MHDAAVPRLSRRLLLTAAALSPLSCIPSFSPTSFRTMQGNAKAHAYQTAAFVYGFADGNSLSWLNTLDRLEQDGWPLFTQAIEEHVRLRLALAEFDADGQADVTAYQIELQLTPEGKSEAASLPSIPDPSTAEYRTARDRMAEYSEIPKETIEAGHIALIMTANGMTGLNAAHDSLQNIAFQKLLLREKLLRGETQVDNFDPNRPKEESLADISVALQLVEDEHRRIAGQRAEILAILTLAGSLDTPGAFDLFREAVADSRKSTQLWRSTHSRPTADDFGVKPAALPSPETITKDLEEQVGFLGGLAKVAAGVVTANPGMALEGLSKLAPEDSSARTALEGLAAATRGDIAGTIDAVAKLSHADEAVGGVKRRLEQLKAAKAQAEGVPDAVP